MFYENIRPPFRLRREKARRVFPLHLHREYECYAVTKGSVIAKINDKEYFLSVGEAVLVFPYQRHEYIAEEDTEAFNCIFGPELVGSFEKNRVGIPVSNKFNFPYCVGEKSLETMLMKKAYCYMICALFDKDAKYIEKPSVKDDLLLNIMHFVNDNYREKCSLKDVSEHVGYEYNYISKLFKNMVGQSFNSYINELRINDACALLRETDKSIHWVAESCGFGTVRSFNQKFMEITGTTPREYKKQQ